MADDGETVITPSTYLGRQVLAVPSVGGRLRSALNYKWIVVTITVALIVVGCVPGKILDEKKIVDSLEGN